MIMNQGQMILMMVMTMTHNAADDDIDDHVI